MPQIITAISLRTFLVLQGIARYQFLWTTFVFSPTFGWHCYLVILVWDALYRAYRKMEAILNSNQCNMTEN